MPKNTKGGAGHRKQRNKTIAKEPKLADLIKKPDEGLVYGKALHAMGSKRFQVACQSLKDPSTLDNIICHIRGNVRRRVHNGDYVLISRFAFNEGQAVISMVYLPNEMVLLRESGRWDFPENKIVDPEAPVPDTVSGAMPEGGDLSDDSDADADTDDSGEQDVEWYRETDTIADIASGKVAEDIDIDTI